MVQVRASLRSTGLGEFWRGKNGARGGWRGGLGPRRKLSSNRTCCILLPSKAQFTNMDLAGAGLARPAAPAGAFLRARGQISPYHNETFRLQSCSAGHSINCTGPTASDQIGLQLCSRANEIQRGRATKCYHCQWVLE